MNESDDTYAFRLQDEFPQLHQFFGGYLHQDSFDYHDTLEEIIDEYVSHLDQKSASACLKEIHRFLELGESAFEKAFVVFNDMGVDVEACGYARREFLYFVSSKLTSSIANKN